MYIWIGYLLSAAGAKYKWCMLQIRNATRWEEVEERKKKTQKQTVAFCGKLLITKEQK